MIKRKPEMAFSFDFLESDAIEKEEVTDATEFEFIECLQLATKQRCREISCPTGLDRNVWEYRGKT